ncbi:MAG: DUF5684 domain-containing protein [Flavobacteriales bacterium]|nr:DUF5684 domain-containing protein [Flavobacteriales bacterium]
MDFVNSIQTMWEQSPGIIVLVGFLLFVGIIGGAKLFAKAGQPWYAAIIPIWNIVVVLKIVGRPVSHLAYFLIPFFNIYFIFRLHIELAQCFGKYSTLEYVFCCVFNVFYLLNLGLAYNEEYFGPVFGMNFKDVQARKPVLV